MSPQPVEEQFSRWDAYAPRLRRMAHRELSVASALESELGLYCDEQIGLFYAPFDFLESGARIAIVGVTPGPTQAFAAIRCALEGMQSGHDALRVQATVKHAASFKGMRRDLGNWFDAVGLAQPLGLSSCGELFSSRAHGVLHTTSAVRYPTFERVGGGWRNWNGYRVNALDHRVLKAMVRGILGPELRALQDAIIVPLGKANEMVEYLCTHGELDASRCVLGFPHPSPASARRHELFAARRRNIERQVDALSQRDGWSTLPVQCDTTPMPEPIASARLAQPAPEPRRPRRTLFDTYGVSDPLIQRTGY